MTARGAIVGEFTPLDAVGWSLVCDCGISFRFADILSTSGIMLLLVHCVV